MTGRRGHPRGTRSRRRVSPGRWRVRARLERFIEPAVLLVLRDSPGHGYELLEQLQSLMPAERIDMGNLYRILRSLEREGLVDSTWHEGAPGPAKRIYVITPSGSRVLGQWVEAFKKIEQQIAAFAERYEQERG
jgi:PadR family transcriptional regulator